jgi:hypothetical protein
MFVFLHGAMPVGYCALRGLLRIDGYLSTMPLSDMTLKGLLESRQSNGDESEAGLDSSYTAAQG